MGDFELYKVGACMKLFGLGRWLRFGTTLKQAAGSGLGISGVETSQ